MKKFLLYSLGLGLVAIISSCGGDDPLPLPTPNFEASTPLEFLETVIPIEFTNNSINASSYMWDFGDQTTSDAINPSHSYEEPGDYTVVLTAFTDDDQSDVFEQTLVVGQRDLIEIDVLSIDFSPVDADGNVTTWDQGSGPDLGFIVGPNGDDGSNSFAAFPLQNEIEVLTNLEEATFQTLALPLTVPLPFTNDDWRIQFFDDDFDIEAGTGQFMFDGIVNPITGASDTFGQIDSFVLNEGDQIGGFRITAFGMDLLFIFQIN